MIKFQLTKIIFPSQLSLGNWEVKIRIINDKVDVYSGSYFKTRSLARDFIRLSRKFYRANGLI